MDILQRTIICYDVFDRVWEIPANRIGVRLCAYGFILNRDGELLVVRMKTTKKLWLPGGGVEIHESLEDGLRRETREETGIEIRVGERIHIMERFFYYQPLDEAYRATMHFFLCDALTTRCAAKVTEPGEATEDPHWMRLALLHPVKKENALLLQSPLDKVFTKISGLVQYRALRRMCEVSDPRVGRSQIPPFRYRPSRNRVTQFIRPGSQRYRTYAVLEERRGW